MPTASPTNSAFAAELESAVAAARAAAQILRASFRLPETSAKTVAAAERTAAGAIRARLVGTFPDDAFGGETGLADRDEGFPASSRVWLVDANDAATACVAGRRGAAVAIALLAGGRPVLGVVAVVNAPDDHGDLITWSEGGVLARNGTPASRPRPAGDAAQVVLMPPAADVLCRQTVLALAPLRFRSVPGVASRLALTAVGDGDAAVVVRGASAAVLAAGQALLTGAGLALNDDRGEPVAFTAAGHCTTAGDVFAGPPATVTRLRGVDWDFLGEPRRMTASPVPAGGAVDPGVLSRAQGSLLGQLCGDALGSLVEFRTPRTIAWAYPRGLRDLTDGGPFKLLAGQPTDDSELALMLAHTLVGADRYHAETAWAAYESWFLSRPFDQGATLTQALCGRPDPQSQANGALMRIGPLGIYGAGRDPRQVALWAREDAALTHPNAVCCDANALFAAAVAVAVNEGPEPAALYERIVGWTRAWALEPSVEAVVLTAAADPPGDHTAHRGWVLLALRNALWQLLHAPSCEDALVDTVSRGGDTDTNAAVCGALLGAVHGRDAIPARWRRLVLTCRPQRRAAGVRQPRPPEMWPTDALELAEALVASGGARRATAGV